MDCRNMKNRIVFYFFFALLSYSALFRPSHGQRSRNRTRESMFSAEVDSFFQGGPIRQRSTAADSLGAASIRSANEVARRPSPFPQHLSPRVIVKNKGQPPAIEPEPEPETPRPQVQPSPPQPPPPPPPPQRTLDVPLNRGVVQRLDLPPRQRQPFPPERLQNFDRTVLSFPVVIDPSDRTQHEKPRDFPAGAAERFPHIAEGPGDFTHLRVPPVNHPKPENLQRNKFFPEPEILRVSSEEEEESDGEDEDVSAQVKNSPNSRKQFQLPSSQGGRFENIPPQHQNRGGERALISDRKRPLTAGWEFHPITSEKTPQKNPFPSFDGSLSPTPASLLQLSEVSTINGFKQKLIPRRLNSSLPFRPKEATTLTSVDKKTRPPVITQDLDKFFANAPKLASFPPKSTPGKPALIRVLPTPQSKISSTFFDKNKPINNQQNVFSDQPIEKITQSSSQEKDSNENSSEEETPNNSEISENKGINSQFVDFSSLTTKPSTSTSVPTTKISTTKVKTVVHPPPSVTVKSVRRSTTTTAPLFPRPKTRTTPRSIQPFLFQAHLPFPSILDTPDPTQTFVDVPRVNSRRRTTKVPRTSTRQSFILAGSVKPKTVPSQLPTVSPLFKVNAKNPKTSLLSNQNLQRPIFRDDFPPVADDSADVIRNIRPLKQHDALLKSSSEENDDDEINVVTSTNRPILDHPRPVITVHRIPKPINRPQNSGNPEPTWKPVIIQQTPKGKTQDTNFRFPNFRERSHLRTFPAPQPQRNLQITQAKRPFVQQKHNPKQTPDYLDIKPHEEVDNSPTETDDTEGFQSAISVPNRGSLITTPLGNRFQVPPSGEEDFPDESSYEVDDYDEEYEELSVPQTTTTTTTSKPRPRKPTTRPRTAAPSRPRKPTGVTRPSFAITSKPRKPSQAQKFIASSEKPQESKSSGSSSRTKGSKCDPSACRLPYCYCGGTSVPEGLNPAKIPQMILLTFDDAVNDLNWPLYQTLFFSGKTNPNGCPILTTLYVSHEWTDYGKVEAMYAAGHEIASHSISHQDGAAFSKKKWHDEIYGQKEILSRYGGVALKDIRGMRAPFLAIGGNKMFGMLHEDNFTYDSSVTILENNPPSWPYTLDYGLPHPCAIPPCPTQGFPGLWEIPMVSLTDLNGGRCSMADSCSYSQTSEGIYDMLVSNFKRHYDSNRAPLGLYYHSSWFLIPHRKEGFLKFLNEILEKDDVYLITSMQLIEWMRNPTPLAGIKNFQPWQCPKNARQPACRFSRECTISFRGDMRSFRTCGECPSIYPWVGRTNV